VIDKIFITMAWFVAIPTALLLIYQLLQIAYGLSCKKIVYIKYQAIVPWIIAGLCWGYIIAK